MRILEIVNSLEQLAPPQLQESYDNAGLLVGDVSKEATGALISLDLTPEVLDEAIQAGINLIISHHPIIFGGLKKLTGEDMVQQVVIKAIQNDIALYAVHTNLDNVFNGVNRRLAEQLGIKNTEILAPADNSLKKIVCFCPLSHAESVRSAMFEAGAGYIGNYSNCSFNAEGKGTFKANEHANPYVGEKGELHFEEEVRIETVTPSYLTGKVVSAMIQAHPYEEVAYDIYPIENRYEKTGAGMIGEIEPVDIRIFLQRVKTTLGASVLRHSRLISRSVQKVALCGGSGAFLIDKAASARADIFITADVKYHDFFRYNGTMTVVDAGHFETEQFTRQLLFDYLKENFPTFALQISKVNTNAVSYF